MAVSTIEFRDAPPSVCNHYDKASTDLRVLKTQRRVLRVAGHAVGNEFIVTHSYGKDYWRCNKWGEWKIHKMTP